MSRSIKYYLFEFVLWCVLGFIFLGFAIFVCPDGTFEQIVSIFDTAVGPTLTAVVFYCSCFFSAVYSLLQAIDIFLRSKFNKS